MHPKILKISFLFAAMFASLFFSPAAAADWWNDQWAQRKEITVNTGASGADIPGHIGTAVLLVRLHIGNFAFETAKADGSDLRFIAADGKTPLNFHIEKYDAASNEALIWVQVPSLEGGAQTPIWMYWGNATAPVAAASKDTYGAETALVYHFAERGAPRDSTGWGNTATGSAQPADGALIGQGLKLGAGNGIVIAKSRSLTFPPAAPLTLSFWVNPRTPAAQAPIFRIGGGEDRLVVGLDNGVPFFSIGASRRGVAGQALKSGSWHHIALVADTAQTQLYVDGKVAAAVDTVLPALAGDAIVGDVAGAAPVAGAGVFVGEIDEMQIANVARSPAFLAAMVAAQGYDSGKLVGFAAKDEGSSWLSGYMAVILKSVTIDGWVVIIILAMMAAVSWVVMASKASHVGRVDRADRLFRTALRRFRTTDAYREVGFAREIGSFMQALKPHEAKYIGASPLFRIYEIGMEQLAQRMRGGKDVLTAQSIEAIRAELDIGMVDEIKRLNRQMVLLTLAISGGPFLGLLGTVIGVMITFASIAATGDVNVNSIAPGIAAALAATVAGLAVAIPALFGYNYLLTRVKNITADLTVFADEFVTKMAEAYQNGSGS